MSRCLAVSLSTTQTLRAAAMAPPETAREKRVRAHLTQVVTGERARFEACAAKIVGRDDAEDAVQEAYLKAYLKAHRFDATLGYDFVAWFLAIVRNECVDRLRRRKAQRAREFGWALEAGNIEVTETAMPYAPDGTPVRSRHYKRPSAAATRPVEDLVLAGVPSPAEARVWQLLERVPRGHRDLLLAVHVQREAFSACAGRNNLSPEQLHEKLKYARRLVRRALADEVLEAEDARYFEGRVRSSSTLPLAAAATETFGEDLGEDRGRLGELHRPAALALLCAETRTIEDARARVLARVSTSARAAAARAPLAPFSAAAGVWAG